MRIATQDSIDAKMNAVSDRLHVESRIRQAIEEGKPKGLNATELIALSENAISRLRPSELNCLRPSELSRLRSQLFRHPHKQFFED